MSATMEMEKSEHSEDIETQDKGFEGIFDAPTDVGTHLMQLMTTLGISAAQLSRRTGGTVNESVISKIVNGSVLDPRVGTIKSIKDALGTSYERLIEGEEGKTTILPPPSIYLREWYGVRLPKNIKIAQDLISNIARRDREEVNRLSAQGQPPPMIPSTSYTIGGWDEAVLELITDGGSPLTVGDTNTIETEKDMLRRMLHRWGELPKEKREMLLNVAESIK